MKTQRILVLLGILGTAVASSAARADAPRYDFADVFYQSINDPASTGLTSDHAFGLDGSYAFTDQFIGFAAYSHESADFNMFGSGTVSGNGYSVGVGYRFPLNSNVDLVPNLSYISTNASANVGGFSSSTSDTGYDVGLQLRAMVTDQFELDGSVDHSSPGSSTNSVSVGALYNFTPVFAVGVGYGLSTTNAQNTNGWTLALRYYFK